jgi:Phosphotransferase enzyme family
VRDLIAARQELAGVVRAAFGPARRLAGVQRLRGGSKKGVYRLRLDDGTTVVGYVWSAAENYWPARVGAAARDDADPLGDASGAGLFEASHARLAALGVRTPRVYLLDRSLTAYPAEIALVEDVPGGTLETRLERGQPGTREILARLGATVAVMHRQRDRRIGKVAVLDGGAAPADRTCEQIVLDRALDDLAQAASRVERVAAVRGRLEDVTLHLAAAVRPRAEHGLIHGELGPDHVLVDSRGRPVLIDIEGLMFFDIEWEHAFLELRYGRHYPLLRPDGADRADGADGLDDRRLRFYRLALHLSLIAGPLRLLDGDFPDREPMMQIVAFNVEQALAFVR